MDMHTPFAGHAEIHRLLGAWRRALHDRDADALVALCTDDVLVFDLAPPLASSGAAMQAQRHRDWFATKRGPIEEELHELRITGDGDVAWATGFARLRATETDGSPVDLWMRVTIGFARRDGAWRVAHTHGSVPFRMDGSLRAALDLRP
ncbi:MAG TPA: SgcJ/EcaC family oxidoreductase [Falsiroseomonas sp.]|jgi:PhnB protein|nr:SgcJ/EcaC family oxidoreductase [Falsiroseomonas sp.]